MTEKAAEDQQPQEQPQAQLLLYALMAVERAGTGCYLCRPGPPLQCITRARNMRAERRKFANRAFESGRRPKEGIM